jgi:hypothetical protein
LLRLRRWVTTVIASLATLACVAASAPAGSALAANLPAPVGPGRGSGVFQTVPPGGALPDDGTCAARVTPTPEYEPGNRAANSTAGTIRLPATFFDSTSHDPRAQGVAARVTGAYTGTTDEILQWAACKWGIDENLVRAQAQTESSLRQAMKSDWTRDAAKCAPGHRLGTDGRAKQCPESFGILQVRYQFFEGAFPDAITSTAFNADTTYAVWRACFEGYEGWLADYSAEGHPYAPGDVWGCIGRWYSGEFYGETAQRYIDCVRGIVEGRDPCQ